MGLFDFFKKKEEPFAPTNELEHLLAEACQNPSARPEFQRKLFSSDLFLLGRLKENPDESKTVHFFTTNYKGESTLFGFTSEEALTWHLQKNKLPPETFVKMSTQALLQTIQGKTGFVVPVDDVETFATHVINLLSNRVLARQLGIAGRPHVVETGSLEHMVDGYERLLIRLYREKLQSSCQKEHAGSRTAADDF